MNENRVILVVEDEKPLLDAIKRKLEDNNFKVVTARSVEQARDYLDELDQVDVLWLDHYLLGKESGLDLVIDVKQEDSKWRNMPIFLVSNTASADKVQKYMNLGVDKYYVKAENKLEGIIKDIQQALDTDE